MAIFHRFYVDDSEEDETMELTHVDLGYENRYVKPLIDLGPILQLVGNDYTDVLNS